MTEEQKKTQQEAGSPFDAVPCAEMMAKMMGQEGQDCCAGMMSQMMSQKGQNCCADMMSRMMEQQGQGGCAGMMSQMMAMFGGAKEEAQAKTDSDETGQV